MILVDPTSFIGLETTNAVSRVSSKSTGTAGPERKKSNVSPGVMNAMAPTIAIVPSTKESVFAVALFCRCQRFVMRRRPNQKTTS
jgi:hypothetical protein